ncbi:MFS transporter [Micromonospora andamanensis]|uniref:MFS transporter n=1 Tax=Micromonospora andamanensis TaxID=1287068 RepID=UPI00194F6B21|nr:MFS transporter [Micromonospora andamanensis]GIJ38326.1 hypothetical protein Vwe01_16510 [Micromonospora andamanensis]
MPRSFAFFVSGYAVSTFGNYVNLVALSLYAYHLTGSSLQLGLLMAVRLAAGFLAGPVAGGLVSRLDRRTVMIVTDLAQALSMVLLLVTPATVHVLVLYPVAVVLGAGNTVFTVALRTSVPDLVGTAERIRGNGHLIVGRSVAMVLGFASAGPMIGGFGFLAAFVVNAASFLVSAIVLACLPMSLKTAEATATPGRAERVPAGLRGLRILLAGAPVLAGMVLLRGVDAWGSASHNVALPILASSTDPASPATTLSQFWTAWGLGMLSTHWLVGFWLRRTGRSLDEQAFAVAACVMSLAFTASFTGAPAPLFVVCALAAGLADGVTELAYTSRLQAAPENVRGRMFGLSATVETFGFGVGMLASAVLLERLSPLPVVATFHAVVVLAGGVFLLWFRSSAWAGDRPQQL